MTDRRDLSANQRSMLDILSEQPNQPSWTSMNRTMCALQALGLAEYDWAATYAGWKLTPRGLAISATAINQRARAIVENRKNETL